MGLVVWKSGGGGRKRRWRRAKGDRGKGGGLCDVLTGSLGIRPWAGNSLKMEFIHSSSSPTHTQVTARQGRRGGGGDDREGVDNRR